MFRHRIGYGSKSRTLGTDAIVVCLGDSGGLFAAFRTLSLHTCSSKSSDQTSAAGKRNVDVDRNVSTCSTTSQRSQQNDDGHSCRSRSQRFWPRRIEAYRQKDDCAALGIHDGPRESRILTDVYPQVLVTFGIIELSAIDHPSHEKVQKKRKILGKLSKHGLLFWHDMATHGPKKGPKTAVFPDALFLHFPWDLPTILAGGPNPNAQKRRFWPEVLIQRS